MKKTLSGLLLGCAALAASAAPPTDESILRLLNVVDVERTTAAIREQTMQGVSASIDGMVAKENLTLAQRAALAPALTRFEGEVRAVMDELLSWERIKADAIPLYRDHFTQDEVDAVLAFYATPAGRAFAQKSPVLAQQTMQRTQERMQAVFPRLKSAAEALEREIRAVKSADAK